MAILLSENEEHLDAELRYSSHSPGPVYLSLCYFNTWTKTKPQSSEGFFCIFPSLAPFAQLLQSVGISAPED